MTLETMIRAAAPLLREPRPMRLDAAALLLAIAEVESSGGARGRAARFEPHLRSAIRTAHPEAWERWGDRLAASYGPFQVLGATARELGMGGPPERLVEPEIGLFWAAAYLNARLSRPSHAFLGGLPEEAQVKAAADAYNSGSAVDGRRPSAYVERLWEAYVRHRAGAGG